MDEELLGLKRLSMMSMGLLAVFLGLPAAVFAGTLAVQNGVIPGLGPFTELYLYVLGAVSAGTLAGLNWLIGWKEKVSGKLGDTLKAVQPLYLWLIGLGVAFVATKVQGFNAELGQACLIESLNCDLFAETTAIAFLGIPIREILKRVPVAKILFAK